MISKWLIFDCVYDQYKWVVAFVKVIQWDFKPNQQVNLINSEKKIIITETWYFDPNYHPNNSLNTWEIGYIVTGQKSVRDISVWDTIISGINFQNYSELKQYIIPWFRKVKPYVFAWVYPMQNNQYEKLKDSFEKLSINDSAIEFDYENNKALWFWFRCGFLGMLHMDIVKERLSREYDIETLFTIPNVIYLVKMKNLQHEKIKTGTNIDDLIKSWLYKHVLKFEKYKPEDYDWYEDDQIILKYSHILKPRVIVRSWADMPVNGFMEKILEPIAEVEVVWPSEYYGNISAICNDARWVMKSVEYLVDDRVIWKYDIPLAEIIVDFYDELKSATKWYATMNYEFKWYNEWDLTKLDILINSELVEAFSMVVYQPNGYSIWNNIISKLKELIPRHMFAIPIQAAFGAKVIARETIPAMKKDVLAKCYGWDVSRKRKLLEKQKEGKKKMKEIGRVSIPNDIFIKMMKR